MVPNMVHKNGTKGVRTDFAQYMSISLINETKKSVGLREMVDKENLSQYVNL